MRLVSQIASIWWRRIPCEHKWNREELVNKLRSELDRAENLNNTRDVSNDDQPSDEVDTMLNWIEGEWHGLFLPTGYDLPGEGLLC